MAEFGAHLTATTDSTPSIFEVLASESLTDGLRAGYNYFIKVLVENNPQRYKTVHKFNEEIYTVFDLLVQWSHLNRFCSSFAENFYSLRRVSSNKVSQGEIRLPKKELCLSLLVLVGFPYLRNKFLIWYSNLKRREVSSKTKDTLETLCLRFYPLLHFVLNSTSLLYQFNYAVGRSRVHSILLHLAGCQLKTASDHDLEAMEKSSNGIFSGTLNMFIHALRSGITFGAFTLQFLEWWHSQDGVPTLGALPIPPPPEMYLTLKAGHCPLCCQPFRNATVLSTSGVVFCYRCVHEHLVESSVCPITKYPSSHAQLVKLYIPSEE